MKLFLVFIFLMQASCMPQKKPTGLKGEALRDHVNTHQNLWKAEVPKKTRMDNLIKVEHTKVPVGATVKAAVKSSAPAPPASFDARTQWPGCPTIGYIRDQSECGSCWAFAAAECMSDRFCIASQGEYMPVLSEQDIMTCCTGKCGYGCGGGYPYYAWQFMMSNGVCTGGGYYENIGCKPYTIIPCGQHTVNNVTHNYLSSYCSYTATAEATAPACTSTCGNKAYTTETYANDKYYGKSAYNVPQNITLIQQEIMTNGPVEASYEVYEDFDQYVSGIYVHTAGAAVGGHAVKIIGWGTEAGTDYWLVANSWDTDWGENGFFRIIRGVNECGFEAGIVAGLPNL